MLFEEMVDNNFCGFYSFNILQKVQYYWAVVVCVYDLTAMIWRSMVRKVNNARLKNKTQIVDKLNTKFFDNYKCDSSKLIYFYFSQNVSFISAKFWLSDMLKSCHFSLISFGKSIFYYFEVCFCFIKKNIV